MKKLEVSDQEYKLLKMRARYVDSRGNRYEVIRLMDGFSISYRINFISILTGEICWISALSFPNLDEACNWVESLEKPNAD